MWENTILVVVDPAAGAKPDRIFVISEWFLPRDDRPFEDALERAALDELHHEVLQPARGLHRVHGHDVRMIELGDRARLAPEALHVTGGGRVVGLLGEHLDRDLAVELDIAAEEDGREPSAAEFAFDLVLALRRVAEAFEELV